MSMEKYGIEEEQKEEPGVKTASKKCSHPADKRKKDGDVEYCDACQKYLKR